MSYHARGTNCESTGNALDFKQVQRTNCTERTKVEHQRFDCLLDVIELNILLYMLKHLNQFEADDALIKN